MFHRLDPLPLLPDFSSFAGAPRLRLRDRLAALLSRGLQGALQQQRAEFHQRLLAARDATDLLGALPPDDGDRAWVAPAAAAVERLAAGRRRLRLTHCERETGAAGFVAFALVDESLADSVRAGDTVCAGVAVQRGPDRQLRVTPRVWRKVCENGAVVFAGDAPSSVMRTEDAAERLVECLRPEVLQEAAGTLRAAARTAVAEPEASFARARVPAPFAAIRAAREEDDDTLYGWVNALTAHARAERDLLRRFALERGVQRLLEAAFGEPAAASAAPTLAGV
jgi:hypothetical protein